MIAGVSKAVAIGCSTGGLRALMVVLGGLEAGLGAAVVVVCHTGSDEVEMLVRLLARECRLPVEEARERSPVRAGVVYVAPSGYHLYIERDRRFSLSIDPKECFVRPSIDVLFESAAEAFSAGLMAVLLTGANDDGARGLRAVRMREGTAVVQNPEEAEAPEMPAAGLRLAGADHVSELALIPLLINRWCA